MLDALAGLRAPLGVYAVPGNHDHIGGHRPVAPARSARTRAIRDLTNRAVIAARWAARALCIAGVDDFSLRRPSLGGAPAAGGARPHDPPRARPRPGGARAAGRRPGGPGAERTHARRARCGCPGIGARDEPREHEDLYEEGLRRRPWTQVYISRGVGTVHLPVRFLCRPEVAVLELTGAPRVPRAARARGQERLVACASARTADRGRRWTGRRRGDRRTRPPRRHDMARQTGVVEFFKDDKGFGFIRPDDGGKDVFVHHSSIHDGGLPSLKKGDRVEFEVVEDPKGPRAADVQKV